VLDTWIPARPWEQMCVASDHFRSRSDLRATVKKQCNWLPSILRCFQLRLLARSTNVALDFFDSLKLGKFRFCAQTSTE
jgi:hypothetical protein